MWMVSLPGRTLSGERGGSLQETPDWNVHYGGDFPVMVAVPVGMASLTAGPVGLVADWPASSVGASGAQTGEVGHRGGGAYRGEPSLGACGSACQAWWR